MLIVEQHVYEKSVHSLLPHYKKANKASSTGSRTLQGND